MDLLDLPKHLLDFIWDNYVSIDVKIFVSKEYYIKYHYLIKYIYFKNISSYKRYIRNIVRNDYSFIFQQVVKENLTKWNKKKIRIQYKKVIYYSMYDYLNMLCIDYNSTRCRNLLRNL